MHPVSYNFNVLKNVGYLETSYDDTKREQNNKIDIQIQIEIPI